MFRPGFSRSFLAVAMCLALAIAALVAFVLHWSENWTLAQIDAETATEIGDLGAFYEQRRLLGLKELVEERSQWRPSAGAVYLLAYRRSGEAIGGNVRRWPAEASFEGPFTFRIADSADTGMDVSVRARAVVLNNVFTLLVGRTLEPRMALVDGFRRVLPLLAAAMGAMGLAAALIIGRLLLRRLEAINATSRAVEAGQMQARAPEADRSDEIGDLARHVNRMLDRINLLVDSTRLSSDRIAHELRTPMTRLRAQLQQAATLASGGAAKEKIEEAIEETRKLSSIFDVLLDISRIETNTGNAAGLECIDMALAVNEVAEFYAPAAEEKGIDFHLSAPLGIHVRGDHILLQRMAANLVDNAIKFSSCNSHVWVDLSVAGKRFNLTVRDSGPGMDASFVQRAFEPFSRAPSACKLDGYGLGLAIVDVIVRRHGFEIAVKTSGEGLEIAVAGPVAAARPCG